MKTVSSLLIQILLLAACGKSADQLLSSKVDGAISTQFLIQKVEPAIAKAGEPVALFGIGLDSIQTITVGDQVISKFISRSASELKFAAPANSPGLATIAVEGSSSHIRIEMPFFLATANNANNHDGEDGANINTSNNDTETPASGNTKVRPCDRDGDTNCLANADFPAAVKTGLAAKVLKGQKVAGVDGSAELAGPPGCDQDGAFGCIVDGTNYKAAKLSDFNESQILKDITIAGKTGTLDLDNLQAANIRYGTDINSVIGSFAPDCLNDGQTDCRATAAFKAVDSSKLTIDNIRNGITIGGIGGKYPSAEAPMKNDTLSTPDLDALFNTKIKNSASFEYWDSHGNVYPGSGSSQLVESNIKSSVSLFGLTGTAPIPSVIDPWNLRLGTTANGTAGQLRYDCRNAINLSHFSGTDGKFITLDDASPETVMSSSYLYPGNTSPGDQYLCNLANTWQDVSIDAMGNPETCDSISDVCIFRDKISGKRWLESSSLPVTWSTALSSCDSAPGFRLPTQKELLETYIHGIRSVYTAAQDASNLFFLDINAKFWSSTSDTWNAGKAWTVLLYNGQTATEAKTANNVAKYICVSP